MNFLTIAVVLILVLLITRISLLIYAGFFGGCKRWGTCGWLRYRSCCLEYNGL